MPDVAMDKANEDNILDLIARLRGLTAAAPGGAIVADKSKLKQAKERQAVLDTEFKADAVATSAAQKDAAIRELPTTGSVRVTLCSLDKKGEAADKKLAKLFLAHCLVSIDLSLVCPFLSTLLHFLLKSCSDSKWRQLSANST